MTTDHRKLRKLRHAVADALITLENSDKSWYLSTQDRSKLRGQARDTLRLALEATAPEPDPGDALDAAEIHPHAPER